MCVCGKKRLRTILKSSVCIIQHNVTARRCKGVPTQSSHGSYVYRWLVCVCVCLRVYVFMHVHVCGQEYNTKMVCMYVSASLFIATLFSIPVADRVVT